MNALRLLFQDEHLVVVEKPGGLLAVPGRGPEKQDCVSTRIRQLIPGCIEQPAVHRLDMATSGLMVLALTREAHRQLSMQFAGRLVEKRYLALVEGVVAEEGGEIRLRFRLDPDNRPYQVYDPVQGKLGVTQWRQLALINGQSLLAFTPLTGRTHQLRLHAAHPLGLGRAIVGDALYGSGQPGDPLCLHATGLRFFHPASGEAMAFTSIAPFVPERVWAAIAAAGSGWAAR